jgi:hypothetical protein
MIYHYAVRNKVKVMNLVANCAVVAVATFLMQKIGEL